MNPYPQILAKFLTVPVSILTLIGFVFTSILPAQAFAQALVLPPAGQMVKLSDHAYQPTLLRGIQIDPTNALQLDFIVKNGDDNLNPQEFKDTTTRMVKYFLAALTTPEKDLWVNLSPYEKNRIVPDEFGKTEMGRDLLAEDYILKQVTSSLIYPEDKAGKEFWDKIYQAVYEKTGSTNIPMNAFNKVWVVPGEILIYENERGAAIVSGSLKVNLEEDLLAAGHLSKDQVSKGGAISPEMKKAMLEVVVPLIEKEVNEGKHFATLRQVYYSLALATWYKKRLKQSVLGSIYMNQKKVFGITINDEQDKEKIYEQYLQAFKKGVFNYVKEEVDPKTKELTPRKYFSGGKNFAQIVDVTTITRDGSSAPKDLGSKAMVVRFNFRPLIAGIATVVGSFLGGQNVSAQNTIELFYPVNEPSPLTITLANQGQFRIRNTGAFSQGFPFFSIEKAPGLPVGSAVLNTNFPSGAVNPRNAVSVLFSRLILNNGNQISYVITSLNASGKPLYTVATDEKTFQQLGGTGKGDKILVVYTLAAPSNSSEGVGVLKNLVADAKDAPRFFATKFTDGGSTLMADATDVKNIEGAISVNTTINFPSAGVAASEQWLREWGSTITLVDSTFVELSTGSIEGVKAFYEAPVQGGAPDFKSIGFVKSNGQRVHLFFAAPQDRIENIAFLRDILTRAFMGDFVALSDIGNNAHRLLGPISPQMITSTLSSILDAITNNPALLKSIPGYRMPLRAFYTMLNLRDPNNYNTLALSPMWVSQRLPQFFADSDRLQPGIITFVSDGFEWLDYNVASLPTVPAADRTRAQDAMRRMAQTVSATIDLLPVNGDYARDAIYGLRMLASQRQYETDVAVRQQMQAQILTVAEKWLKSGWFSGRLFGSNYELNILNAILNSLDGSQTDPKIQELLDIIAAQRTLLVAQSVSSQESSVRILAPADRATVANPEQGRDVGGINLDPTQINMQIESNGQDFAMNVESLKVFKDLNIDGVMPIMIGVIPFNSEGFFKK